MSELSLEQLRAAKLWVLGKSPLHIADELGITTKTFYRWLGDEDFKQHCKDILEDTYKTAMSDLQGSLGAAVHQLNLIITDDMVRVADKLRAIEILFKQANLLREFQNEERLEVLEQQFEELKTGVKAVSEVA
jgi:AcrR family transcriptional regulator